MKEKIIDLANSYGVDIVGFGDVNGFAPKQYYELVTAISFAVRLSDTIIDQISDGPTHEYFHLYRSANRLIDDLAFQIVLLLQKHGYKAIPIAASQTLKKKNEMTYKGLFSHRLAATRSGVGWIGKNNSIITSKYGPRVRLGTVLTNLVVEYDNPIEKSYCEDCNICVESCPAFALSGNGWDPSVDREKIVDVVACSNYMRDNYKNIGRGSVCGICISKCPIGQERV